MNQKGKKNYKDKSTATLTFSRHPTLKVFLSLPNLYTTREKNPLTFQLNQKIPVKSPSCSR